MGLSSTTKVVLFVVATISLVAADPVRCENCHVMQKDGDEYKMKRLPVSGKPEPVNMCKTCLSYRCKTGKWNEVRPDRVSGTVQMENTKKQNDNDWLKQFINGDKEYNRRRLITLEKQIQEML